MEINEDTIKHIDHVALEIDPQQFIGGAILTKRESDDLVLLAGRLYVTVGYGQVVSEILMSMVKPKPDSETASTSSA